MCAFVIVIGRNYKGKLVVFILGSVLGYFLERWGTTRLCWVYYTGGMPPFFTVLAHGMASVAIFQVYEWVQLGFGYWRSRFVGKAVGD
jgi:hypothetical protein